MATTSALEKRIKRHVIGRERTYFAATAPGLESVCAKQLHTACVNVTESRIVAGGVEFQGRLEDCYLANLHLRCANRILLRIDDIKATSFDQLERGLARIDWQLYLAANSAVDVNVTTRHCRLYHSGAIAERVRVAATVATNRLKQTADTAGDKGPVQRIFIRGINDCFTVSLDSSGEHLHKRGLKKDVGVAPIRETLAAAILELAGYAGREPLLDPMCGSGTFSTEAAMIATGFPPGYYREFAFMTWPSFRKNRWGFLKKKAAEAIRSVDRPLIHASDIDEKACARLTATISGAGIEPAISVRQEDFFSIDPEDLGHPSGLVVINPPYGRRLGAFGKTLPTYQAIAHRLTDFFGGWKFAMLVPDKHIAARLPLKATCKSLLHGGLRLTLLYGIIRKQ